MYENAISFINDITQGFYFNQNFYYLNKNTYLQDSLEYLGFSSDLLFLSYL